MVFARLTALALLASAPMMFACMVPAPGSFDDTDGRATATASAETGAAELDGQACYDEHAVESAACVSRFSPSDEPPFPCTDQTCMKWCLTRPDAVGGKCQGNVCVCRYQ